MSPKDREMMGKIFEEVEANSPLEQEVIEMTELEVQQLDFAMHLIATFENEINKRIETGVPFFLAPPPNFSYMAN